MNRLRHPSRHRSPRHPFATLSLTFLLLLLLLPACGRSTGATTGGRTLSGTPPPGATATPVPVYPQLALGVSVSFPSGSFVNVDQYLQQTNHKAPATIMVFKAWAGASAPWYDSQVNTIVNTYHAVPMISWMPTDPAATTPLNQPAYTLANITAGNFDTYIDTFAKAAKAWGGLLYMRLAPEMNGNWFPWSPGVNGNNGGPSQYVAMWQHVWNIFHTDGATNVRWVWSVNVGNESVLPSLYPGEGYVDWVGISGYNFGSPWQSLYQVYASIYSTLLGGWTSKNFMITEAGCPESGGDKAGWIRQGFLSDLPHFFPRILAVVYYDQGTFSINTSTEALAAYNQVVQSYQGRLPT